MSSLLFDMCILKLEYVLQCDFNLNMCFNVISNLNMCFNVILT